MRPTLRERLLAKAIIDPVTGCWNWSGSTYKNRNGQHYGKIRRNGRTVGTHIVAYELLVGPVPEGLVVDHECRNTLCCNPAHLCPKTQRQNILCGEGMGAINARKTHCKNDHPFDLFNTYFMPSGSRRCRECERQRDRARYARKRDQANELDEAA